MAKTAAQLERQRQAKTKFVNVGGRLVPADVYGSLSRTEKARLQELGVERFSGYVEQERARFKATHRQVGPVELDNWVKKEEFAKLSVANQELLMELGTEAFNALQEAQKAEYRFF